MTDLMNIIIVCCFIPFACVSGLFVFTLLALIISDAITSFKENKKGDKDGKIH